MRHSQPLVHPHRQRQRFRTQLHRRRSQGIRGLSRIPSLHSSPTSAAATDGNIKASPDGLPHHLVLILRLDFFYFQSASAATLRGQRHGDHLIDLLRHRFAVMLAVGGTGLAPWWFWVGFPLTAGKGCGLSLVGPLGFFQLALQPLVFLTQPSWRFSLSFSSRNRSRSPRSLPAPGAIARFPCAIAHSRREYCATAAEGRRSSALIFR